MFKASHHTRNWSIPKTKDDSLCLSLSLYLASHFAYWCAHIAKWVFLLRRVDVIEHILYESGNEYKWWSDVECERICVLIYICIVLMCGGVGGWCGGGVGWLIVWRVLIVGNNNNFFGFCIYICFIFGIFSHKHNNLPSWYRLLLLYFERKDWFWQWPGLALRNFIGLVGIFSS